MADFDIIDQGPNVLERQTDLMASGNVRLCLLESRRASVDNDGHTEEQQKRDAEADPNVFLARPLHTVNS